MKKILAVLMIIMVAMTGAMAVSQDSYAADPPTATSGLNCKNHFLGLRAWYDGLTKGSDCAIDSSKFESDKNGNPLKGTIWLIVINLTSSVLGVVGYLAICFVIWGGYQYMLARGDPGKVAKGKKTITNALIGLVVCMLASTITGMIADIAAEGAANGNIFTTAMNKAFTWAAIVSVIVVVIGGIQYITSNGNPAGVTKAKQTITYALIGLAISLLAIAIVNFVVRAAT